MKPRSSRRTPSRPCLARYATPEPSLGGLRGGDPGHAFHGTLTIVDERHGRALRRVRQRGRATNLPSWGGLSVLCGGDAEQRSISLFLFDLDGDGTISPGDDALFRCRVSRRVRACVEIKFRAPHASMRCVCSMAWISRPLGQLTHWLISTQVRAMRRSEPEWPRRPKNLPTPRQTGSRCATRTRWRTTGNLGVPVPKREQDSA